MVEGGENLSRNDEFLVTVHQWVDMPETSRRFNKCLFQDLAKATSAPCRCLKNVVCDPGIGTGDVIEESPKDLQIERISTVSQLEK